MEVKKLSEEEIKVNLERLRDWKLEGSKLHKLFKFKTFRDAFQFMTGVAIESEKLNHHPEWSNVYGNVDVKLITHKVAGITELDFKLAERMDEISKS